MQTFLLGLTLGWGIGGLFMYYYINRAGLFRTRREFYAARRAKGLPVPSDWDEE